MSRPRTPYGTNQPGRLPATMMTVLAAEMADPERLRRGKRYAKGGSVVDIVIEPGTVVCEVQGSRSTPYIATLEVTRGDGMPLRRDVHPHCTCPDIDNLWGTAMGGSDICKHVVAAMFVFADELLIEPELLDVWRGRAGDSPREHPESAEPAARPTARRRRGDESREAAGARRHLRLVHGIEPRQRPARSRPEPAPEPEVDPLVSLLSSPDGTTPPEIGRLEGVEPLLPADPETAAVLADALSHLRMRWDD